MKTSSMLFALFLGLALRAAAAEGSAVVAVAPMARPRLTDAARARVDKTTTPADANRAVTMEKVVVREKRVPDGPPKEQDRAGEFTITQGGYVVKKRGESFTTELGLWRHIDIIEDPRTALNQSDKIRMGILRISW